MSAEILERHTLCLGRFDDTEFEGDTSARPVIVAGTGTCALTGLSVGT